MNVLRLIFKRHALRREKSVVNAVAACFAESLTRTIPTVLRQLGVSMENHRMIRRGKLLGMAALALGVTYTAAGDEAGGLHDGSQTGLAAVYSDKLNGHRTASGTIYSRNQLTAAHKTLPFGTHVQVTNLKNGRTVTVTINDRGPLQPGRILDITPRAARRLDINPRSIAKVEFEVVK